MPIVLMHDRAEARYRNVVAEVIVDLQRAVERAVAAGVAWERCLVDPGIGFGKTRTRTSRSCTSWQHCASSGDRSCLAPAASRPSAGSSTAGERAAGRDAGHDRPWGRRWPDIVRVHDIRANVRVADGRRHRPQADRSDGDQPTMTDRIVLSWMRFDGRHGVSDEERAEPQPFEVDVELYLDLQPAGIDDDLQKTVDYSQVFELCRDLVEATNFRLLETIAEGIAHEILVAHPVTRVSSASGAAGPGQRHRSRRGRSAHPSTARRRRRTPRLDDLEAPCRGRRLEDPQLERVPVPGGAGVRRARRMGSPSAQDLPALPGGCYSRSLVVSPADLEIERGAVTEDGQGDLIARPIAHQDVLERVGGVDALAIDGGDDVVVL